MLLSRAGPDSSGEGGHCPDALPWLWAPALLQWTSFGAPFPLVEKQQELSQPRSWGLASYLCAPVLSLLSFSWPCFAFSPFRCSSKRIIHLKLNKNRTAINFLHCSYQAYNSAVFHMQPMFPNFTKKQSCASTEYSSKSVRFKTAIKYLFFPP